MNTRTLTSVPTEVTPETMAEIHEFYIAQVNHLVEEDREWMIPGLTADYDRLVEQAERTARAA
jgi:hypothetical protein